MLLYADSKLDKLQALATELNTKAQEAKDMLSPSHIQNALQSQFNTLHTQHNEQIHTLSQTLQEQIATSLQTTLEQLKNDNAAHCKQALENFLNDEKIKSFIELDTQELIEKITQDFITTHTDQIHQDISQSLTEKAQEQLKEGIANHIQSHFLQSLQEMIISHLDLSTPLPITLEESQISTLAECIYANTSNADTFYIAFSKIFNEKLTSNPELLKTIESLFLKHIEHFHQSKALDFKYQLLRQYDYLHAQLDNIAFSNHICLKQDLEHIALEYERQITEEKLKYEQELAEKRQEWQESLQNPNSIKHNVYQAI